jgi:hypothetical protein
MNKPFITYDVTSIPDFRKNGKSITLPEILTMRDETGYLFYDSKKGNKPEIMNGDLDIKIVDYRIPKWQRKFRLIIKTLNKKLLIKKLNDKSIS